MSNTYLCVDVSLNGHKHTQTHTHTPTMSNNISRVTCHVDTLWFFTYILYWTCFLASVPVECFMIYDSQIRHMWQVAYSYTITVYGHWNIWWSRTKPCVFCVGASEHSRVRTSFVSTTYLCVGVSLYTNYVDQDFPSHMSCQHAMALHISINCVAHDFLHRCLECFMIHHVSIRHKWRVASGYKSRSPCE